MFEQVAETIRSTQPEPGQLAVWWLGQAGYACKTPGGALLLVDPYLTDAISKGYRPYIHDRLLPPVVQPDELTGVDGVIYTHTHMDHMDETTAVLLSMQPGVRFFGSQEVCDKLGGVLDIPESQLSPLPVGAKTQLKDLALTACKAVHSGGGQGYLLELEGRRFYFAGDTVLFRGLEAIGRSGGVECAFLPINGQGGNMDMLGAAWAAHMLGARQVVPGHYGMYIDSTADPERFCCLLGRKFPQIACRILQPGACQIF